MATRSKKLTKQEVKPVFDPSKSYSWHNEDVLPITGAQVDLLNKALSILSQDPAVQRALAIVEAGKVVTSIIRSGFEEGIIVPTPEKTAE